MMILQVSHMCSMQSVGCEELVELPAGVHFVTKEWVGDCLAQGKLLSESRYLIDLAQIALLAKLQVPNSSLPLL